MFLVYINDLPRSQNFEVKLFADDTCLLLHSKNPSSLEIKINDALTNIQEWTSANKLTVNPNISSVLIISPKKIKPIHKLHIKYDNTTIPLQDCVKYLGIVFDSRLTFVQHIQLLEKKINRSMGIMYKLKNMLFIRSLTTLYYALVHLYLLYGILVWGATFESNLKRPNFP